MPRHEGPKSEALRAESGGVPSPAAPAGLGERCKRPSDLERFISLSLQSRCWCRSFRGGPNHRRPPRPNFLWSPDARIPTGWVPMLRRIQMPAWTGSCLSRDELHLTVNSNSHVIITDCHTRLSVVSDRVFAVAASRTLNILHQHVTSASSLPVFRARVKT